MIRPPPLCVSQGNWLALVRSASGERLTILTATLSGLRGRMVVLFRCYMLALDRVLAPFSLLSPYASQFIIPELSQIILTRTQARANPPVSYCSLGCIIKYIRPAQSTRHKEGSSSISLSAHSSQQPSTQHWQPPSSLLRHPKPASS